MLLYRSKVNTEKREIGVVVHSGLSDEVIFLFQAIRGSIAHGVILSSTQITDEQDVPTLSGRTITLYNTNQGNKIYF